MSDELAICHRVLDRFTGLVDSITAAQWSLDTPCSGWTVRDLIEHVVIRDRLIAQTLGGPPCTQDKLHASEDLPALWHQQLDWWAAGLADPVRSNAVWPTYFGELTFQQAVPAFMTGEIAIHTWDLARALGADETLDSEAVEATYAHMAEVSDQLRGPDTMEPAIDVPEGADPQVRLLALTGRRP